VAGSYDPATKKFRWAADESLLSGGGGGSVAGRTDAGTHKTDAGAHKEEAWQWLLLQPFTTTE
jgi:hypothetical protein